MGSAAANPFSFGDDLGPKRVIHVYEPSHGVRGILVVDNTAVGPAIGGLRMAPDVTLDECFRLARAMTLKNAAAGLAHGGGKSILIGNPLMNRQLKEGMIRAMARALGDCTDYIFGPDMGTDETCMAWIKDEIGRAVGLPASIGGIPLDEVGATGYGLFHACEAACRFKGRPLAGARIVVQGFGAVGRHAARYLTEKGAIVTGVSDSKGCIEDAAGLDVTALIALKAAGKSVADLPRARVLPREAAVCLDCDILIPAARPDVIREDNVDMLKAAMIVSGANIPMKAEIEARVHKKGILNVPDFIANAGGVICAAMEFQGSTKATAFQAIGEKITANTQEVLEGAKRAGITTRDAAVNMALARVRHAMSLRRFSIF